MTPFSYRSQFSDHPQLSGQLVIRLWDQTRWFIDSLRQASASEGLLGREFRALRQGWECVLGRRIDLEDLFDEFESDRWDSDAEGLLTQLVRETHGRDHTLEHLLERLPADSREAPAGRAGLRKLISECNHRSYFNHQVSRAFGVPYAPNAARLPLRHHQYLRAVEVHEHLATAEFLEESYKQLTSAYSQPRTRSLQLPILLGAALAKVNERDQILEALAGMRDKARAFRSHRAELDLAIREGDLRAMQRIRDALESDAGILRGLIGYPQFMSAVSAVLAATTGEPFVWSLAAALAVVSVGKELGGDVRAKITRLILQPEYWFLTDVASTARAMTNSLPQIGKLWTLTQGEQEFLSKRFERLAGLRYG